MKKVMVFGVFDGVHEGHRRFLAQARECGGYLVAVVTRDEVVLELKNRRPKRDLEVRIRDLESTGLVDQVVEGDAKLGGWEVIGKCRPDVIVLGYDQEGLREDLERYLRRSGLGIGVRVMKSFEPERYHSSILNQE